MGMVRKNSTLILKNLSDNTDLETLLNKFKPYGQMSGIRIRSSKKDKSIVLGFIEYKSINASADALEKIQMRNEPFIIDGQLIEIDYALPQQTTRRPRRYSATVTGLNSEEVDSRELMNLLGCLKVDSRNDRVVALYKNNEDLQKALNTTEDFKFNGKKISLEKFRNGE